MNTIQRRPILNEEEIEDLIVFDYREGGMKIPYTYTSNQYNYNLPTVTSQHIVGKCTITYAGWNTYYPSVAVDVSKYKYVLAEIKPAHEKNREFYLLHNVVIIPDRNTNWEYVYLKNPNKVTGDKTNIAVKMTVNYIRQLRYTNTLPEGAIEVFPKQY